MTSSILHMEGICQTSTEPRIAWTLAKADLEDGLLDDLRVDGSHAIDCLAPHHCQVRHVDQPACTPDIPFNDAWRFDAGIGTCNYEPTSLHTSDHSRRFTSL